ncbi:MAG: hypothetical protein ACRCWD_02180 [Culicoidibacterales bacterium]
MENTQVNVLGTEYTVKIKKNLHNKKQISGVCLFALKEIHIQEYRNKHGMSESEGLIIMNTTLMHELVHAFLYESGLDSSTTNAWARNEEIVDFFALQIPKITKAHTEVSKNI